MKRLKRVLAFVLAMTMLLAMSATAFATTATTYESATITINNAGEDAKFLAVQVIEPDSTKETGWKICNDAFRSFMVGNEDDEYEQSVIKMMIEYAEKGSADGFNVDNYITALNAAVETVMREDVDLEGSPISVSEAGVYAIMGFESGFTYSVMAGYISFKYTDGIPTKLESTTIQAKKKTDGSEDIKSTTDEDHVTQIGETLTYVVQDTIPYFADNEDQRTYILKDVLTGAEYVEGSVEVMVVPGGSENNGERISVAADKIIIREGANEQLTVDLSDALRLNENFYAGMIVRVIYDVVVSGLQVGNEVQLGEVDADGNFESNSSTGKVDVYTGEITLTKRGEENNSTLSGAKFKVYYESGKEEPVNITGNNGAFGRTDNNNLKLTNTAVALNFVLGNDGVYTYVPEENYLELETTQEIETGEDGTVKIQGLGVGYYFFEEVKAPDGYSINTELAIAELKVEEEDGVATANLTAATSMTDTKLSALPSTGGIGTTIFTIGGVVLMIAAAGMFFVTKKKKAN